ncbi:MAG: branched-chain amino acid aminotransferase [Alphaproteobacteria bacterium]|nr:branched-chain amino acid aminotransferase [Alphaproteobacteria bacterium]
MATQTFDDRDGWIWWNGKMVPWREAKLHVLSHGLHYASCVFEGERVYGGNVFHLTAHSQRLIDSARMLGFEIPFGLQAIDDATREVAAANRITDGYLRPVAWRGSEMMGVSAQQSRINVAIACWAWPSYFAPEIKTKGIRLQWSDWKRPSPETIPCKSKASGLYMICTLAKHKAESEGYQDAMMLDYRGYVAEATGANVFFVREGEIHTPTPDCFLDGITRRHTIGLARGRQMKVIERHIKPEELSGFQECFLTGTAAEITPVGQIGEHRFVPGAVTRRLIEDFEASVRAKQAA